jgi:hypothetical protein
MKPICQNIVTKDSLYPLIKHHVPLCTDPFISESIFSYYEISGLNLFSYLWAIGKQHMA